MDPRGTERQPVAIGDVGQYVDFLAQTFDAGNSGPLWFRGQTDVSQPLVPRLLRNDP